MVAEPIFHGGNPSWWEQFTAPLADRVMKARLVVCQDGIIAGVRETAETAELMGIQVNFLVEEGAPVAQTQTVALFEGPVLVLSQAENLMPGILCKPSGVATASTRAVALANGKVRIVVGALKKVHPGIRPSLLETLRACGVETSLSKSMIYLDKNMIRAFGSLKAALVAASRFPEMRLVVQLRGEKCSIVEEAVLALRYKADVLMVDTGIERDVLDLLDSLNPTQRSKVEIAYSGNVGLEDIGHLSRLGIDSLCIGRAILDAPMLDFQLDIITL